MDTPFSQLSKELQSVYLTIPMYLSVTQNPDAETEQQVVARQDRFLQLPKATRFKLASFEIGNKIEAIGRKYGFELLRLANITRLVREYYFGEVQFEDFAKEIEKRMSVSAFTAQEIARYLKQEIINWDPWGKYIASFPKMTIREIVQNHPKIAEIEITADYIKLRNSEDLEDPTIKNWLQDYISHLGYEKHSQMDRTQYIFHSENGKNLSSQDREKLGIILRSFDENIPLPVDEENGEIVFDSLVEQKSPSKSLSNSPFTKGREPVASPPLKKGESEGDLKNSFIKPYAPISQPQRQTPRPAPAPVRTLPPQNFIKPIPVPQPQKNINPEIDKYFSTPESPDIPSIKIHSITEHNEPRSAPQALPLRPASTRGEQTSPPRPNIQRIAPPQPEPRPKYKIIDPFSGSRPEPRIDGNIVDLSGEK